MKIKLGIITTVLAVCGIVGLYVVNTEIPHDNTISKEVVSKNKNSHPDDNRQLRTADPQPTLNGKGTRATQTVAAQTNPDAATPALVDIRSLDIVNKLNRFDGSENDTLRHAFALNEDYDFQPLLSKQDRKGNQHTRYQQTYRDVPVWGEQVLVHQGTVHKGTPGDYYAANGKIAHGLEFSELDQKLASIDHSEDALREIIRSAKEINQHLTANWTTRNAKSELVIYLNEQKQAVPAFAVSYLALPREGYIKAEQPDNLANLVAPPADATPEQQAAYEILTERAEAWKNRKFHATRPHMLIDAQSHKVIKQWEGLNTATAHGPGGNEKTGRYEYGVDYPALLVSQVGDTCSLNNHKVKTIDLQHKPVLEGEPYSFTCPDNNHKAINGAYSPLNDAHFFGGLVYDMFQDWFYLAPLNFQLTMAVHYGNKFNNAFWTGEEMVFGDGWNFLYPLVDVNVSAHEVAHGFTEQNAGLFYIDESGGINEAFSDIAGEAAEFYWKGEVDWLAGADILIGEGALRYFADPPLDGRSIGHASSYYPGIDVHFSSGVFNRAFYLLANTANWDVRKAFEIFVLANQFYWEPNETFIGGACGVLSAANDLGFEVRDVDDAFQTVGVNCGAVPFTDSDRDGMDNVWEMRFDLDPRNPNDANTDADGDGLPNVAEYHERTNPQNPDSDGDGIPDLVELYVHETNPNLSDSDHDGLDDFEEHETWLTDPAKADTDEDGMPDGWEVKFGLAPRNPDAENDLDGDGVSNLDEFTHQSDPSLTDSDGDGLDDYAEINIYLTNPTLQDTDRDGLHDADELERGTNPRSRDTDNDYLGDGKEFEVGSSTHNPDTDNDSLMDGDEVSIWLTNPLESDTDFDGMPDRWEVRYDLVNPRVADADQDGDLDGLSNLQEYESGLNPDDPDTDHDGLNDYLELFVTNTNPFASDTDGDSLPDGWEFNLGLDPLDIEDAHIDSDGDGWLNKQEYEFGTHPLSAEEALDGLPAKPRVSDGATVEVQSVVTCIDSEVRSDVCLGGFTGAYGWDARFGEEVMMAMIFSADLPWTVESGYHRFSALTSPLEEGRTLQVSYVDEVLSGFFFLSGLEAQEYANKIKNGPHLASVSIQANPGTSVVSYETTSFNLPSVRLNQGIVIGKSISNLQRLDDIDEAVWEELETNRLHVTFAPDADDDGIMDDWELLNGLDPSNPADALEDRDQDGATNFQEYLHQTDLDKTDSDGDGMPDGWEIRNNLDPLADDSQLDKDRDGLTNLSEYHYRTSPLKQDSNGDGVGDRLEIEIRMTAQYDEQFQTPACHTVNVQCRSGTLLSGRGAVNFKPETNTPNTLYGACLDGNEELTRPVSDRPNPSPGIPWPYNNVIESIIITDAHFLELSVGNSAEIAVTLSSGVLHEDSYLDIFYTTDIDQPEWTLLDSFGLTVEGLNDYALPIRIPSSEQNQHAIRAVYRYGGAPLACTQGEAADHDDLVFTVHTEPGPIEQPPMVKWTGQSDTWNAVNVYADTILQATALDSQHVDRVLIEIYDFNYAPWEPGLPTRVFSQSFQSPPFELSWNDTWLDNRPYVAKASAIYNDGTIAVDELAVSQRFREPVPRDGRLSFPDVSLVSPAEGATVKGDVFMAISASDLYGVNQVMVEILDANEQTVFSRTLAQTESTDSPPPPPTPIPPTPIPSPSAFPSPTFSGELMWNSAQVPPGLYQVKVTAFNTKLYPSWNTYNIWVEESDQPTVIQKNGDGDYCFEAEDTVSILAIDELNWESIEAQNASNETAMQATAPAAININEDYENLSPRMDYQIDFPEAGIYTLWLRGQGPSGSADSVHAGLNGQALESARRISAFRPDWYWSRDTMDGTFATIDVPEAGVHTLNIWMRESGFILDKILLTMNDYTNARACGNQ